MREPFVGLRPFTAEDKDLFFGRSREIEVVKQTHALTIRQVQVQQNHFGRARLQLLPRILKRARACHGEALGLHYFGE